MRNCSICWLHKHCFTAFLPWQELTAWQKNKKMAKFTEYCHKKNSSQCIFFFLCKFQEHFFLCHLHACKCVLESVPTDSLQGPCCNYTTHRLGWGTLRPLLPNSCFACKLKVLPTVAFMTPKTLKLESVSKQRVRFLLCTT